MGTLKLEWKLYRNGTELVASRLVSIDDMAAEGRKTITTTHGRYTAAGSMSEKVIRLMEMPYEKTLHIHDAETGEEITGREDEETGEVI